MICFVGPIIITVIVVGIVIYTLLSRRESYKDPIYLNRDKMVRDWYPRSNGSIYGVGEDYYTRVEDADEDFENVFLDLKPYNKIYYPGTIYYGKTRRANRSHNLFSGVPYLDTVL